jgi:transcriptional regulator with XRE-family HTH domain
VFSRAFPRVPACARTTNVSGRRAQVGFAKPFFCVLRSVCGPNPRRVPTCKGDSTREDARIVVCSVRCRYFVGLASVCYLQIMTLAYAEEAIHVHDTGHLSDREIARATGAAPSTVREWLARRSAPSGVRAERLAELSSLVERLARVIRPTYIPVWLSKPVPALDDDKPIDRIAKGDYRSVAQLISGIEDPGAS